MTGARVLLDATAIPIDRGGVGRYVEAISSELDEPLDIAVQARDAERIAALAPQATVHPQSPAIESTARRFVWEQTGLPLLARRLDADVIFSPHYTAPLLWRGPTVVTFHDATFFSDRAVHSRVKGMFFRTWCRISAHRATRIIVPSHATAREFARYLPRPADRYDVAYHGVDTTRFRPSDPSRTRDAVSDIGLADGAEFILFLGTIEPRKNVPALIRGYAEAAGRIADPPALVLAGGMGWETGVEDALHAIHPPARVVRPGFVREDALPALLSGATVMAYPSLGEGFGLPILEAMACGTPVLTTDRLALGEVGGPAVAYTEVDDLSIADSLTRLLTDPDLRAALSAAGVERAAGFTWNGSARAHRRILDEAAGGNP